MITPSFIRPIVPLLLIILLGCAPKPPDERAAFTEPLNELIRINHEESELNVTVTPFANTVWIYLPLEESFLQLKATPKGPLNSDQSSVSPAIKFIDGWFADGQFTLKYDIAPSKGYAKDYGYTSQFSEDYQAAQQKILSSINRAYSPLSQSQDHEKIPDFFAIVIADITNGLEARVLLNFEDIKRAHVDHSFHGEYAKRVVSDQPIGDANIIGDKEGNHIDYKDFTWPEFLAKQMVYRINFKYQRSSFPPSDDTRAELLTIAADTVAAYDFTDFTSIELQDLNTQAAFSIPREDLTDYRTEQSKGRLIHIKFQ